MAPVEATSTRQTRAASPAPRKSVAGKAGAEEAAAKENVGTNRPAQPAEPEKASAAGPKPSATRSSIKEKLSGLPRRRLAAAAAAAVLALAMLAFFLLGPGASSKFFQEGAAMVAQHPVKSAAAAAAPVLLGGAALALRRVASKRTAGAKAAGKAA